MGISRADIPTEREKRCHRLRAGQGLSDAQIGELLGLTRECVCRLRANYRRKEQSVRIKIADLDCSTMPCRFADAILS